jgi:hypothetical protein
LVAYVTGICFNNFTSLIVCNNCTC